MEIAHRVLDLSFPPETKYDVVERARRTASALVRSLPGKRAISTMAELLMESGNIDGDQIDEACAPSYGRERGRFGSWYSHWPPGLEMIRKGWSPSYETSRDGSSSNRFLAGTSL